MHPCADRLRQRQLGELLGRPVRGPGQPGRLKPQLGGRLPSAGWGGFGLCPGRVRLGGGQSQLCLCHLLAAVAHRGGGPEQCDGGALHPLWPGHHHALPHGPGQCRRQQPALFRPDPAAPAGMGHLHRQLVQLECWQPALGPDPGPGLSMGLWRDAGQHELSDITGEPGLRQLQQLHADAFGHGRAKRRAQRHAQPFGQPLGHPHGHPQPH